MSRQELLRLAPDLPALPRAFPALLKPHDGSGNIGITTRSLVHDAGSDACCLRNLLEERATPARIVAEEYLPGRKFSVAVLGATGTGEEPIYQLPLTIEDKVQRTVYGRQSEARLVAK
ncbi:hypothetical protein FEI13_14150 [Halomonas urmiana]|uniref:D-alanine--D-alanine ligase n=1 Tax=Halomonas urmiana TaxID=490901 RepID=A0A5R8ME21_9GAMM|nr:hypothetical protein [Halomonas urmiana]TLF47892.1 hypothetical protein FEI13_14150 [Halomonas urmiana]